jgi:hypothetical protein
MKYFIYFWGEWKEVREETYYHWKRLGFAGRIE